jgi:replicative DNA helicase
MMSTLIGAFLPGCRRFGRGSRLVWFRLVRSEYYETDEDAKQKKAGEAELIIAKQRNGPTGDVPLSFLKEFTRFENRAREKAQ